MQIHIKFAFAVHLLVALVKLPKVSRQFNLFQQTLACFFIWLTQAIFRLQSKHLLLNIHHSLSKPRQTQIFQFLNHLPPLCPVQPPKDKIVVQQLTQPYSLIQHMMEDVHQ